MSGGISGSFLIQSSRAATWIGHQSLSILYFIPSSGPVFRSNISVGIFIGPLNLLQKIFWKNVLCISVIHKVLSFKVLCDYRIKDFMSPVYVEYGCKDFLHIVEKCN